MDDPVGAVPVHGMNGVWGTLSIGLFGQKTLGLAPSELFYGGRFAQLGIQALGRLNSKLVCDSSHGHSFQVDRCSYWFESQRDEELKGLDIGEHGMESYAGFQIFVTE